MLAPIVVLIVCKGYCVLFLVLSGRGTVGSEHNRDIIASLWLEYIKQTVITKALIKWKTVFANSFFELISIQGAREAVVAQMV
jgi:hypothetical protein